MNGEAALGGGSTVKEGSSEPRGNLFDNKKKQTNPVPSSAPVQKNTFRLSKNKHKMPSSLSGQGLAKSTTLGNFFRKL